MSNTDAIDLQPNDRHHSKGSSGSTLAKEILDNLTAETIAHCHWKSNDHLHEALDGSTDLDLLVDSERLEDIYRIFSASGLRRGRTAGYRSEPGLEDFLGYDRMTGNLVHIHTHYRLVTGERHLKRYRLPWEREVFSSVIKNQDDVYIPHPSVEATLLIIRVALKIRTRDRVGRLVGRSALGKGFDAELQKLRDQTSDGIIIENAGQWIDAEYADLIARGLATKFDTSLMLDARRRLRNHLKLHTSHRGAPALAKRLRREVAWFQRGLGRYYLNRPRVFGRGLPSGGLLVAFIGSDGSGKSSLIKDLRGWFSEKVDTMSMYFGSGDGSASILRWPLNLARKLNDRRPCSTPDASASASPKSVSSRPGPAKVVWAIVLAHEKRAKLKKAMRARDRGMLVICDRYPQSQFPGINDGPMLGAWAGGGIKGRLARYEARVYETAEWAAPDLVIRFNVDQAHAQARRPEHDPRDLTRRRELVAELEYPRARFGIVDIDANQPYDDVLEAVKAVIWVRI
jgi:thymidylate kinase